MKNKKIALCISGQARKYDISYNTLYDNIIKDNKVDIFFSYLERIQYPKFRFWKRKLSIFYG